MMFHSDKTTKINMALCAVVLKQQQRTWGNKAFYEITPALYNAMSPNSIVILNLAREHFKEMLGISLAHRSETQTVILLKQNFIMVLMYI